MGRRAAKAWRRPLGNFGVYMTPNPPQDPQGRRAPSSWGSIWPPIRLAIPSTVQRVRLGAIIPDRPHALLPKGLSELSSPSWGKSWRRGPGAGGGRPRSGGPLARDRSACEWPAPERRCVATRGQPPLPPTRTGGPAWDPPGRREKPGRTPPSATPPPGGRRRPPARGGRGPVDSPMDGHKPVDPDPVVQDVRWQACLHELLSGDDPMLAGSQLIDHLVGPPGPLSRLWHSSHYRCSLRLPGCAVPHGRR
jgi:hypothetical protein